MQKGRGVVGCATHEIHPHRFSSNRLRGDNRTARQSPRVAAVELVDA